MVEETKPSPLGSAFKALLAASATSNLGDGIRLAALPLLATRLTDSPQLITGVTAAQFLPWLLFGPIGGVIVDRADRRRLILATQAWRALVMAGLAVAAMTGAASIWMVFAVAFVITVGEILVDPSVVAMVPSIVGRQDLDRANGRISSVEIVTNDVVGAPVGTWLFVLAPWMPFAADAASYLGSVFAFRRLPKQPPQQHQPVALAAVVAELPQGLRWLLRHRMLRPWTAAVAVFNLGAAGAFSLLVLLILDVHDATAASYGLALTLAALAGVAGSTAAPGLANRFGRQPVLLVAAAFGAVSLLALAAAPTIGFVVAIWSTGGALSGVMLAIGRGYVQRYCPPEILGRAAIASRTITRTAFVVGAIVAGSVAARFGIRTAFAISGMAQAVALLPMALALRHDHD